MQHTECTLIFPHQLFQHHPAIDKERKVFLVEETLFFNQYNFHKQKLVLHRASMQFYLDWLKEKNYEVEYIESTEEIADVRKLIAHLHSKRYTIIHVAELIDDWLNRRIQNACKKFKIELKIYQTPAFITSLKDANEYFGEKQKYFQTDFYIWQRKQHNILIEAHQQPKGGKWSFDYENRKRFPKKEMPPALHLAKESKYVTEARKYIEKNFGKNYGSNDDPFFDSKGFYPVTFLQAKHLLTDFIKNRFEKFGEYEDAIVENEQTLHHSVLSSSLNIGLLTPKQIIDEITETRRINIKFQSILLKVMCGR